MVFNTTFTNISAISERSVLLVKETGVPVIRNRVGTQKSLQQVKCHPTVIPVTIRRESMHLIHSSFISVNRFG